MKYTVYFEWVGFVRHNIIVDAESTRDAYQLAFDQLSDSQAASVFSMDCLTTLPA